MLKRFLAFLVVALTLAPAALGASVDNYNMDPGSGGQLWWRMSSVPCTTPYYNGHLNFAYYDWEFLYPANIASCDI